MMRWGKDPGVKEARRKQRTEIGDALQMTRGEMKKKKREKHTSSNSSCVGFAFNLRLSSTAFLNMGDWSTGMVVVSGWSNPMAGCFLGRDIGLA